MCKYVYNYGVWVNNCGHVLYIIGYFKILKYFLRERVPSQYMRCYYPILIPTCIRVQLNTAQKSVSETIN